MHFERQSMICPYLFVAQYVVLYKNASHNDGQGNGCFSDILKNAQINVHFFHVKDIRIHMR